MVKWIGAAGRLLLMLSLLLGFQGCASAPPSRPERIEPGDYAYVKEYTSWLIAQEMKRRDVVGLSIALVDDQQLVWAQGFGYADQAKGVAAGPETLYRVGSISKLFTATAAMQLAEQGRLDIDQPLIRYLPEFSFQNRLSPDRPVTPRLLMTHHSGLPGDLLKGMFTRDPQPFTQVVQEVRNLYAPYPPNLIFSYSNLGLSLLGHAIQNVSGRPFADHLETSLLRPLGMNHSQFLYRPSDSPLMSKGYRKGRETAEPGLRDLPAGGLNSSALEMSRFLQMIFAGGRADEIPLLQAETLAEMLRPQNSEVALDLNFKVGLGYMLSGLGGVDIRNAGTVAHHSGGTILFHSLLIALPEQKLGVVVLANSDSARAAVQKVGPEALKLALEVKTGHKQPVSPKVETSDTPLPPAERQRYVGRYATQGGLAEIFEDGDRLQARAFGKTFRLVPRVDGLLGLRYFLLGLIPIDLGELNDVGLSRASIDGREVLIARSGDQKLLLGEKINPVPVPEKWLKRLGDYEIVNPEGDFLLFDHVRLAYENELLLFQGSATLQAGAPVRYALNPVTDHQAVLFGLGRGLGETLLAEPGQPGDVLIYSGYRLKRKP
jgi:CubicO group peptidase (beta-lactamase class C family)